MAKARARGSSKIPGLVQESRFIFNGTVQRLRAATMPAVPVTEGTAIVRVNQVFESPSVFSHLAGSDITVQLTQPARVRVGQQAIFFANGWLYGNSLAVVEVGRISARTDHEGLRKQITEANQKAADQNLQRRINVAQFVIVGKVSETRPLQEKARQGPVTEHDPDWWEAVIEVQSAEKGKLREKRVTVIFPNSTDEMWIDSPKFRPGQEGIWILQRDQKEKGWPVLRAPGLTALHPLDFHAVNQLDRIRALTQRGK